MMERTDPIRPMRDADGQRVRFGNFGMAEPVSVLVVEDNVLVAMALEQTLADAGYAVTVADTNAAARTAAASSVLTAALVDYHLPDGDSLELCAEFRRAGVRVALITGLDRTSVEALGGLDRVFYKPVDEPGLLAWLSEITQAMPNEIPTRASG